MSPSDLIRSQCASFFLPDYLNEKYLLDCLVVKTYRYTRRCVDCVRV